MREIQRLATVYMRKGSFERARHQTPSSSPSAIRRPVLLVKRGILPGALGHPELRRKVKPWTTLLRELPGDRRPGRLPGQHPSGDPGGIRGAGPSIAAAYLPGSPGEDRPGSPVVPWKAACSPSITAPSELRSRASGISWNTRPDSSSCREVHAARPPDGLRRSWAGSSTTQLPPQGRAPRDPEARTVVQESLRRPPTLPLRGREVRKTQDQGILFP